jgi:hypothetical protein
VEEKKVDEQYVLTGVDDQTLMYLLKTNGVSPALKEALQKAIELRSKLTKTTAEIAAVNGKLRVINEDQARQRENMKVIPQSDPVYKTYLNKFLKQEELIDTLRAQISELQATAEQQRQAYESFVANLSLKDDTE